ncbi:MAG: SCO family protein [Alphaproteobacteria bacterium]
MAQRARLIVMCLALVLVVGFLLLPSDEADKKVSTLPPFGGDFSLKSQADADFSLYSVRGSFVLMFFGFTHCPEVCPLGLKKMSDVLDLLPKTSADRLAPMFITVDPLRDTPMVLASYLSSFSPKIIGLTGTEDQIADVVKRYAIYAEKVPLNTPAHDESGHMGHGDYTVNHTTHFILLDPQGNFVKLYADDLTAQDIRRDLALVMGGG